MGLFIYFNNGYPLIPLLHYVSYNFHFSFSFSRMVEFGIMTKMMTHESELKSFQNSEIIKNYEWQQGGFSVLFSSGVCHKVA